MTETHVHTKKKAISKDAARLLDIGSAYAVYGYTRDSFIVALAKSGATYSEIGRCVSLSRERVRQIVQDHGIFRQMTTAELHQKIAVLAAQGKTVPDIAADVGRDFDYVDHYCRQNKLRVPRRDRVIGGVHYSSRKPSEDLDRIQELILEGKTTMQIALDLNHPYHAVYALRKRKGI
jgi:DNA-binding CsgD family transcriptional regulator